MEKRHDDPTINTISKTLEAQEKTQDIKQSLSTKIGTKPNARSRRNMLDRVTGRSNRTLEGDRPDASDQLLGNSRRQQQRPDAED